MKRWEIFKTCLTCRLGNSQFMALDGLFRQNLLENRESLSNLACKSSRHRGAINRQDSLKDRRNQRRSKSPSRPKGKKAIAIPNKTPQVSGTLSVKSAQKQEQRLLISKERIG
jgi:hypothetical protein